MSTTFLKSLDLPSRARAVDAITKAIDESWKDGARQTQRDIKHRFNICVGLLATMRSDLGWSWTHIADTLPAALRSMLDAGDWSPPTDRAGWVTDSKSGLILPAGRE